MKVKKFFSLKFQVFLFTALSGVIPLLLTVGILNYTFMHFFEDRMEKEVMQLALEVADNSNVKTAFTVNPPHIDLLQETSNELKTRTGSYVIFIDMNGTALIDPFPIQVRTEVMGEDKERVLNGEAYTSRSAAYSTPAIRAFVPIINNGIQVGAVVAAFLEPDIQYFLSEMYHSIYTILPIAFILIIILSLLLAHNIKKRLFGMEPSEIGTKLMEREGILHSVREGIIATDENLYITVINQSAAELFPNDTELIGKKVTDLISDLPLAYVIATKKPLYNQHYSVNESIVLTNTFPLFINDKVVGTVITIRMITEVNRLAEELTGVKRIVEALRARTHEFSNKLHAISGLLQLGSYEEAKRYVISVQKEENSLLSCLLSNFKVNSITGLLMGKASEAEEKRINFKINPDSSLYTLPSYFDEHSTVVVLGNLIENAFDAAKNSTQYPEVYVSVIQSEKAIEMEVRDNGTGIAAEHHAKIFNAGYTTKANGTGYGLPNVKSRVNAAGGEIIFVTGEEGTTFKVVIPFDLLAI